VLSSRSPRPSKYNFYVELGKNTYIKNACLCNGLFLESKLLLMLMKSSAFLRCLYVISRPSRYIWGTACHINDWTNCKLKIVPVLESALFMSYENVGWYVH
jgi:hypothetical protein